MDTKQKTLGDHAEDWARENGMIVPQRFQPESPEKVTPEWMIMYMEWWDFCFANLDKVKKENKRRR